ncbi:WD40/YVTN/BNR-like repeat-containing protein [Flavobacterium silvisoli]|nr:YCF48-related protein [Flavobacterium silvisoli]
MKNSIYLLAAITLSVFYSCSSDSTNNTETIPDLSLSNLITINANIPQDYYDGLTFTDENTGYAVSRLGKIVKTTDGGVNWNLLNSNVTFPLKEIQFVTQNTGFVIGGDNTGSYLLKTTNAGQSWTTINLNNTANGAPNGMFFKNENEGFITGNKLFIKTTDGGLTWTSVLANADENFNDVKFRDSNYGIATVNSSAYYKTIDGGQNWQSIDLINQNNLSSIYFVSGKTVVKNEGKLINLLDNSSITLPNPVNKLLYLNALKCIGIGQHYENSFFPYGDILLTNNNWGTFLQKSYQPSSEAMNFTAVAKMDSHKIMILGNGQLHTMVVKLNY